MRLKAWTGTLSCALDHKVWHNGMVERPGLMLMSDEGGSTVYTPPCISSLGCRQDLVFGNGGVNAN